ncbi:hypothetical protein [Paenibacillus urinalis]|uniref:hypothetical protein n=1 Tax=Paenibacillus urinalis TaxID=521520 RepID=UPI00195FD93C
MKRRNIVALFFGTVFIFLFLIESDVVFANKSEDHLYLEQRDESLGDEREWLTIQQSEAGLRIISSDGKSEVALLDNFGGIYLSGDLFLNNKKLNDIIETNASINYVNTVTISIIILFAVSFLILVFMILRLQRKLNIMKEKVLKVTIKGEEQL